MMVPIAVITQADVAQRIVEHLKKRERETRMADGGWRDVCDRSDYAGDAGMVGWCGSEFAWSAGGRAAAIRRGFASSRRPQLPRGASHRTVQVLFTYGSSGRRLLTRRRPVHDLYYPRVS
jgi:hypothetical protein